MDLSKNHKKKPNLSDKNTSILDFMSKKPNATCNQSSSEIDTSDILEADCHALSDTENINIKVTKVNGLGTTDLLKCIDFFRTMG